MTRFTAGRMALLCALFGAPMTDGSAQAATLIWPIPSELHLPAFDTSFYLLVAPYIRSAKRLPAPRPQRGSGTDAPRAMMPLSAPSHPPADSVFFHPWFQVGPGLPATPGDAAWARQFQRQIVALMPAPGPWDWWISGARPAAVRPKPGPGAGPVSRPGPPRPGPTQPPIVAGQTPAPVPLPGSALLLAAALAFGVFFGRRSA